jgi:hypothetical protein
MKNLKYRKRNLGSVRSFSSFCLVISMDSVSKNNSNYLEIKTEMPLINSRVLVNITVSDFFEKCCLYYLHYYYYLFIFPSCLSRKFPVYSTRVH